MYLFNLRGVP